MICRYYQTRALALAQEQVNVTKSLINANEEQNEIFRGIAQSLKRLADIAENNDSIANLFQTQ